MLLKIEGLLAADEVTRLRTLLKDAKFDDGKLTAGVAVRDVKNNLQTVAQDKPTDEARTLLGTALLKNEHLAQYALPRRVLPPMFNRYDTGMEYGGHVDNAIMGGGEPMRADLSVTVFLTAPADYDGGELVIHADGAAEAVKLAAGSAVVYPSTSIHKVQKITRGSRLAGVTWIQSFVRDEPQRDMLFELMQLARWSRSVAPGSPEAMKISKLRSNLMRMWAEV
ncbi:MAG TPA: Fe2+-dependent dioxygenase [Gammaproteobacteria bacterium]|jgi:PKHD-type hydroxylase|nr:Fe2+-dependent dioxygenase [Gammaproteobacteria bacterium]